ncbi:MAG TPA: hypothetical protein VGK06_06495 [Methanosarcina sp.]
MEQQGFNVINEIPFILLPNVFTYELNIEQMAVEDLERIIAVDLAARSLYPNMHGEMYMVVSKKPNAV